MHQYFGEILQGKRAVITGGNRGLGLLMARRFLECGAKVAICCAPQEDITEAVAQLRAIDSQYEVVGFAPHLCEETELTVMLDHIEQQWGGLDILVNNAGLYPAKVLEEYPKDLFDLVMDVNVTGTFLLSKLASKRMAKQGKGAIVNTSSMAGIDGAMRNIGYTASKFAVEGLTLGMARELGAKGIRVNAVAPAGILKTDVDGKEISMTATGDFQLSGEVEKAYATAMKFAPLGRFSCHPDEIINAFIFLASDAASFISGQTIAVSGACIWPAASPASSLSY